MKKLFCILFAIIPLLSWGQVLVFTVAGSDTATAIGDGGQATAGSLVATEGIWMDGNCNLYVSDMGHNRIRKINTNTGIITTIAGTGVHGFSGDNGPATNAMIYRPYGLYADVVGNVYFADLANSRIRRIDAITAHISTIAGGGSMLGDGGPATNAQLNSASSVYGDLHGNIYIGESGRIRIVTPDGNIATFAGNGIVGLSGDNGPATSAQLSGAVSGMAFDGVENFYFADRGNARVRKINTATGIISTVAGTTYGYSGNGGQASNAQLANPISIALDIDGNLIIGDNENDFIRIVNLHTGLISTVAGTGLSVIGSEADAAPALSADVHPEFIFLDLFGNLYFSSYSQKVRKITGFNAGLAASGSVCGTVGIASLQQRSDHKIRIFPNPAAEALTINVDKDFYAWVAIVNDMGIVFVRQPVKSNEITIDVNSITPGLYHVIVTDVNNVIHVEKIVKQ